MTTVVQEFCIVYVVTKLSVLCYYYAASFTHAVAALGVLCGISLIVNIMLVIAVLFLLIKPRAKPTTKQSSHFPDKRYTLTDDTIETKPNKVYGISSAMEQTQPVSYEYVNS